MKIRVALVVSGFHMGGAEHMVYELIRHLPTDTMTLKVFCVGRKTHTVLEDKVLKSSVDVVFLHYDRPGIVAWYKVSQALKQFRPHVIHSHIVGAAYVLPYLLLHKVKLIHTIHTSPEIEFSSKMRFVLKWLCKTKKAMMVTVSESNREKAVTCYSIRPHRVVTINNGVDLERFYREEHAGFTYINVGRQDVNKNQRLLIRAFKKVAEQYEDVHLIWAGDGNQHEALFGLTGELGLMEKITFPGMVAKPEYFLAKSDVYVQTSRVEGLPLAVLEAMAAGLPIISTPAGGMKDIVRDNGILIPFDEVDPLVDAMIRLKEDEEMRISMGKASKEAVKPFGAEEMAKQYHTVYLRTANRS